MKLNVPKISWNGVCIVFGFWRCSNILGVYMEMNDHANYNKGLIII